MKQGNAIDIFVRNLKVNFPESLNLLIYSSLFVVFSYYLIKGFVDREPILNTTILLVWTLVGISGIVVNCRSLINKKFQTRLNNTTKNLIFSRQWLSQDLPAIILVITFHIPFLFLIIIGLTSEELTEFYASNNSDFESFRDGSSLLIGTVLISQHTEQIFKIKQKLFKRIFIISSLSLTLLGAILYLIYTTNLAEITP